MNKFMPKIVPSLKNYNKGQFICDLKSGIIVAIIALPLSIAFALGCGVSPEKGVYSAIISSIMIALLGGSRVQINGPTGAFIVIINSILISYGMDGLMVSMILAGIILIFMGIFQLGNLVKYIPSPITVGFTAGIGITIFTLEIKNLLGLSLPEVMPTNFFEKWSVYLQYLSTFNLQSFLLGMICIIIIVVWSKINKNIPASLIVIILGSVVAFFFQLDVALLGEMPKFIHIGEMPHVGFFEMIDLIPSAFTIAILICLQALLSASVTDGLIVSKTNATMELIAQGSANIVLGILGCIPATGGVARSIANCKNGARTPVAAIVHGITLFCIMIFLMPFIKLVPLCVLSSILIVVAINMINIPVFIKYFKVPKSDLIVLFTACFLTFALDLIFAILVGMVLACALFMKRMADETNIYSWIDKEEVESIEDGMKKLKDIPKDTLVFEISGPLFFGAAEKFVLIRQQITRDTKVIILRMGSVPAIDITALQFLEDFHKELKEDQISLVFSHLQKHPKKVLVKSGLYDKIGAKHFCNNIDEALGYAKKIAITSEIE
ncbi:MAG: SulP family inorganic anion transporter [Lachnospiraceae bacterium]